MGVTQPFNGAGNYHIEDDSKDTDAAEEAPGNDTPTPAEPQSIAELQPLFSSMFIQLSRQIGNLGSNLNSKISDQDVAMKSLAAKADGQKDDIHDMVGNM